MSLSLAVNIIFWLMFPLASATAFEFSRPIENPQSQREELLAVLFDSFIYSHTGDSFSDLRLFDSENIETPYLIDKLSSERSQTVRKLHNPKVVSLEQFENHSIEIQLRLEIEDPAAEGLILHTPLINFEHRVQVFGSQDAKSWSPLVESAVIYDYSKFIDLYNREISLPTNNYHWLKVRVEEPIQVYESENLELTRELKQGQEQSRSEFTDIQRVPLRIDRIEYWYSVVESSPAADTLVDYPIAAFSASQDQAKLSTLLSITTQREPLSAFIIQTANRNFNRSAVVEIPDPRPGEADRWREIGAGTLQRQDFRALHLENPRIEFQEQRHGQFRVVIQNDNNPPLEISAVQAQGHAHRLLFFAETGKNYALAYGDASVKAPVYDTASLRSALAASYQPVPVKLGPESPTRTLARKPEFDFALWFNSDLFLGGVIVTVVVILGLALVLAAKRIDPDSGE